VRTQLKVIESPRAHARPFDVLDSCPHCTQPLDRYDTGEPSVDYLFCPACRSEFYYNSRWNTFRMVKEVH
jgi:hypothetical protein